MVFLYNSGHSRLEAHVSTKFDGDFSFCSRSQLCLLLQTRTGLSNNWFVITFMDLAFESSAWEFDY